MWGLPPPPRPAFPCSPLQTLFGVLKVSYQLDSHCKYEIVNHFVVAYCTKCYYSCTFWSFLSQVGGNVPSEVLQEAQIDVYTNAKCRETWGNLINDGQVCVGDFLNNRGSCNVSINAPYNKTFVITLDINRTLVVVASSLFAFRNAQYRKSTCLKKEDKETTLALDSLAHIRY